MMKNKWQYVIMLILIVLLVSEVIWYSPYTRPTKGSFSILGMFQHSEGAATNVTITYQLAAYFPLDATVVVTPVMEVPRDLPIYVFYDTDYPTVATDWIFSAMLQAHLKAELILRNYSAGVKLANAEELENILLEKKPAIVIMASGAFPSNIFSKEINLVKPWIDSGGILVWFGFHIGYYVVEREMRKEDITDDMPQNFRENGSKQLGLEGFFEYLEIKDNPKVATSPSRVSEALETTYDLILQAPLLHMVWAKSGLELGKVGGEISFRYRPSISMIPVGAGKIIIFGFFLMQSLALNGPEFAAWDIAQILCSGVLQMNPAWRQNYPWHQSYRLSRGEVKTDTSKLIVESEAVGFVIFEYTSQESDGVLFYSEFINKTSKVNEH